MILGLIIAALLFGGVVVILVFAGVFNSERKQKNAEANSEQLLDALFDGRPDVTYTTTLVGMKPETVIVGGKQRGYRLVTHVTNQYGTGPMVFEKVDA